MYVSFNLFVNMINKLEDIKTVKTLVHQGCFLASLDMKDAYYLISIEKKSRKFLRFIFTGKIYKFTCLSFGLNVAAYLFTKIMKPVITFLRKRGFLSAIYFDDLLLIENSYKQCEENLNFTTVKPHLLGHSFIRIFTYQDLATSFIGTFCFSSSHHSLYIVT